MRSNVFLGLTMVLTCLLVAEIKVYGFGKVITFECTVHNL